MFFVFNNGCIVLKTLVIIFWELPPVVVFIKCQKHFIHNKLLCQRLWSIKWKKLNLDQCINCLPTNRKVFTLTKIIWKCYDWVISYTLNSISIFVLPWTLLELKSEAINKVPTNCHYFSNLNTGIMSYGIHKT